MGEEPTDDELLVARAFARDPPEKWYGLTWHSFYFDVHRRALNCEMLETHITDPGGREALRRWTRMMKRVLQCLEEDQPSQHD